MNYVLLFLLLILFTPTSVKAQYKWVGDHPLGNFSFLNNWYGNTVPVMNRSDIDLLFEYNNASQTSTIYDFNYWAKVRSIIFLSTFSASVPLNSNNGNGFNFWFKIENLSSSPQFVNTPLSAMGTALELNPINDDLTINNMLYNELNTDILVYGPNRKKLSLSNAVVGNATTQLLIKQYSIASIGFANTAATNSFGGGVVIETGELWFEENSSINGGNITLGKGNSNEAKLYIQDVNGGYSLPNNIIVSASSPYCNVGGLNTSGTNVFAGSITLNSALKLENSSGGTTQISGNISGSHNISINNVGATGNATIEYAGISKTYTGTTTINSGATLRISSNQSLNNIVINTGGKLIVNNGVKLTVNGTWTGGGELENNGTIEVVGSTVFPGSTTSVISMNILQINRAGTVAMDNNLTITGSLIITAGNFNINSGKLLTLHSATLVNGSGFLVGSSTSDLTVSGSSNETVFINSAISLRNISVIDSRIVTLNGTNNLNLYGTLTVGLSAIFNTGGDASQITNNGAATINISGTFITQHPGGFFGASSAIPTVPVLLNNGSTIEYARLGDQQISSTPSYFNIRFSGSGIKTPNNAISVNINGTVFITGACTVDASTRNIASTENNSTGLTMNGGVLILGTAETLPLMRGTYNISGGIIQYVNGSFMSIRSGAVYGYQHIEILGSDVNNGAGNISLNSNGTFTIKNNAVFTINSNSIIGALGIQTVTIELGGKFNCSNVEGFYGPTVSSNSPSIRNNVENVVLNAGSTVVYSRSAPPLTGGNQKITNTHSYQNLEIAGSGVKTAPSSSLTVQGNLCKTGTSTFSSNNGLVLLNGTDQTFAGLGYSALEMTGGTKTTNGKSTIDSLLQLNAFTNLSISNTDTISILSTALRTARVGEIGAGATINYNNTGSFRVERYIRSGRKWRLLSIPNQSSVQSFRSAWQEGATSITHNPNPGYGFIIGGHTATAVLNGFDQQNPGGPSIKILNGLANNYTGIPSTLTPLQTLYPLAIPAFMSFISGNRSGYLPPYVGSTTLRSSGKLFIGNPGITFTMPASGEYIGIGNPFASPINMKTVLNPSSPTGIQDFYVFDPNLGGGSGLGVFQVLSWEPTTQRFEPTPGGGSYESLVFADHVESGVGFFLQGNGVTTAITITEAAKTSTAPPLLFIGGSSESLKATLLLVSESHTPQILDGFKISYSSQFEDAVNGFDILKTSNSSENAGILSGGKTLIVERKQKVALNDTIHIKTSNLHVQNYQWQISITNMDYPGRSGFLIDRYLNTSTSLNLVGTTTVNFSVQNISGSFASDRFKIVFRQDAAGPLPVSFTTVTATRNLDRTIAVQWKVEHQLNISSYEVERSNNGSNFIPVHNRVAVGNNNSSATYNFIDGIPFATVSFYRIKATSINGLVQYSNIVKLEGSKGSSLISLYPNPVENKKLQLRFEEQDKGKYPVQLISLNGQVMFNKTLVILGAVQLETIELSASIPAGNYQLKVTAPNGNITQQSIVVQ